MTKEVLHLTHTIIYEDSRILKEIETLSDTKLYEIYAEDEAAILSGIKFFYDFQRT